MLNQSLTKIRPSATNLLPLPIMVCLTTLLLYGCTSTNGERTTVFSNALNTSCTLAISNINLVPMDNEQIIPAQTVLISREYIIAIGPSSKLGTTGCIRVIPGKGRYLMPGLNDMHTHLETVAFDKAFGKEPISINYDDVLAPYLAYGITGLRLLSGAPDILLARNKIQEILL